VQAKMHANDEERSTFELQDHLVGDPLGSTCILRWSFMYRQGSTLTVANSPQTSTNLVLASRFLISTSHFG